jgi:hypothetical protein
MAPRTAGTPVSKGFANRLELQLSSLVLVADG